MDIVKPEILEWQWSGVIKQFQTKLLKKALGCLCRGLCFNLVFKKFSYQKSAVTGLAVLVGQPSENDVSNILAHSNVELNSTKKLQGVLRGAFLVWFAKFMCQE